MRIWHKCGGGTDVRLALTLGGAGGRVGTDVGLALGVELATDVGSEP